MEFNKYLLLSFLLTSTLVNAESFVYVTDTVDLPLRSENKIRNNPSNLLRNLPSGTKLEILATENGWTKVRFEKTTGWMISRYLTSNPPAKLQLNKLKQVDNTKTLIITQQKEMNKKLAKQLQDLKINNTKLLTEIGKSKAEKTHIKKTYQEALKLEHTNEKLKTKVLQLQAKIQLLQNNNTTDAEASSRNWFIVGAIVLFFGFITGVILSRRKN